MNMFRFLVIMALGSLVLGFSCKKDKAQKPTLYILDVNSREVYDDAHIKGAVHSELDKLEETVKKWDRTIPIIVYCSNYMCTASGYAAQKLRELGFTTVYAYEGGMAEWYQLNKNNAEYAFEGPGRQEYLSIVVEKPEHTATMVRHIAAQDLQKMMKQANIL